MMAWTMKPDYQLRQEIANARRQLRERKRHTLGLPSSTPRSYTKNGHEYLQTTFEKTKRRMEIFRAAGGEVTWFDESDPDTIEEIRPATCQGCVEPHLIGWLDGEWHHNCELRKKCDSAACALYVCAPFHRAFHNRIIKFTHREPQFGGNRRVEANG